MSLTRRNLLKRASLSAGALALSPVMSPVLAQLKAQAAGVAGGAKRFLFVMEGNGLPWQQVTPAGVNRGKESDRTKLVDLSMKDLQLTKALEPLAPWKDRLTVINGLSGKVCGGGHSNNFGALGVYPAGGGVGNSGSPRAETIDAAIGKKLGGIFPHVGLGITDRPEHNIVYNCSAWDRGKPLPTTCHPMTAYANLFGSVAGGQAKAEFQARSNVLDFLTDDLKRLQKEVGSAEKEKFEAHVGAYEALRNRQSRLNEIESTLRKQAPVASDKYKSDVETDRLDAHFDLAAASLIGGLTNVVTIASGVGDPYFSVKFGGLGVTVAKHTLGHGGNSGDMKWDEAEVVIRRFHFEQIARLMKKLQAVPEGSGTMLDNTVIVYLSDAAESHHSRCWEWPLVMIGNAGGKIRAGRYVEYPYWGNKGHRELGNFYTTLLHTAGEERPYVGMHEPALKGISADGPLPELLA
jgi:hypothetical protein